jgi:hypothetical protein
MSAAEHTLRPVPINLNLADHPRRSREVKSASLGTQDNSRPAAPIATIRSTRSWKIVVWRRKSWPVVAGSATAFPQTERRATSIAENRTGARFRRLNRRATCNSRPGRAKVFAGYRSTRLRHHGSRCAEHGARSSSRRSQRRSGSRPPAPPAAGRKSRSSRAADRRRGPSPSVRRFVGHRWSSNRVGVSNPTPRFPSIYPNVSIP